jgi:hypothetical protein
LIKKGVAIGEARGEAREKRNTIRILQSILGLAESPEGELANMDVSEMQARIEKLRVQIGNRFAD